MGEARKKAWSEADLEAGLGRSLQPADWIRVGLELLVERGVGAVRVTRLAEALDVTRGSFYWHFKDRDDLLRALIAHWERTNTAALVEAAKSAPDLASGILELFEVWVDLKRFDPRLDSALRDWGRQDDAVHQAVAAADQGRIAAIAGLYERNGFTYDESFVRARVIYFGQVGYYALDLNESLAKRCRYLEPYFEAFTGRSLDPAAAAAFRDKHLGSSQ